MVLVRKLQAILVLSLAVAACAPGPIIKTPPQLSPLPAARHGHRVHLVGDELILIGGFDEASKERDRGAAETWRMMLADGQWRRAADMPSPRSFFGSCVVGGSVVAIGGGIDRYDPKTDRWETLIKGSFPDSHFGAAAVGSRVYVLGGFPTCAGGCIGYDLVAGRTFDPPEPPGYKSGDHFHVLVTLSGELHVIGGLDAKAFSATNDHWVLRNDQWKPAAPPTNPVWAKFSIIQATEHEVFIFEGKRGQRYDARTDRWTTITGTDSVLVMPASIELNGSIHVLGGMQVDGGSRKEILTYSIARDQWRAGTD